MTTLGATASTTTFPATAADVGADASGTATSAVSTHAGAADPHTVYALESALGTMSTQAANSVNISGGAITGITDLAVADGGTGSSTAANARTALGLVIASDVASYTPASGFGTPPTGVLAETYGRNSGSANDAVLATTTLQMVLIQLPKGITVTSIQFYSATTALGVGVNQWFALFDVNRNMLRVTSDDTSTAWAANSAKSLNLSSTYLVPTSGLYYLGIMVKATTVPTLMGIGALGVVAALAPVMHGSADTGLSNPASCPNPATTLANPTTTKLVYATVS